MTLFPKTSVLSICASVVLVLSGCAQPTSDDGAVVPAVAPAPTTDVDSSIFDIFENRDDPNVTLEVNRFLWSASLEVLSFMPLEAADPFSGILVMGYGTPPGGGTAYRATVHIKDPALDARSLNVALATRSGPVAPDTARTIENAILTRARQLRIAENGL